MKIRSVLACAAAVLAVGLAAAETQATKAGPAHSTRAKDWSLVVSATPAGGFVMGNPRAKVKLVEYGSMTCPHCAHFDEDSMPILIDKYVKSGKVSFEFRNYVRDTIDVSAALLARCEGAGRFFPLTRALFKDQRTWEKTVADTPQEELTRLETLGPDEQFLAAANVAGFHQWAAAHGISPARSKQCLTDSKSINKLVQMADDTTTQYPNFPGTPSFTINGTMVEFGAITAAQVWPTLESRIKSALGEQSPTNGAVN
jgi:protein-disulfide isomerase